MAQILKFEGGGTLTIDGVKYDINDHLISQYRFLVNEFDDPDQKKYYNNFMSTLKKGLTDKNINIEIDRNKQYITGIDLSGYTEKQLKAIDVDQTDAGKLITHLFRPEVEGAKKAGKVLLDFNPSHPTSKFKHYFIDDKIILNHQHNQNTGEFIITDGKKQLVDGQDSKVTEITNRIDFAKNIDKIPIYDKITGYNNETRDEITNTISDIGDLEAFKNRLLEGNYTEEDENRAKIFGIFMDTDTLDKRKELITQYEDEQKKVEISNKAGAPTTWEDFATINNQGYYTLNQNHGLPLQPGYNYYFLNNEFFDKYPIHYGLKGTSKNGYFIIDNVLYNADHKETLPEGPKAVINKWIDDKKQNNGKSSIIYDDWYGDNDYQLLTDNAYFEGLQGRDIFGIDLIKYYNLDTPSFAYFDIKNPIYDDFGNPKLTYVTLKDGKFTPFDIADVARRTQVTNKSSFDIMTSHEYRNVFGGQIAYLGDKQIGDNLHHIFFNKTQGKYYALTGSELYEFDINSKEVKNKYKNSPLLVSELRKVFKLKKGGKIYKCQDGTSTTWWNKPFPTDFVLGTTGLISSIVDTKKYYKQLKEANTLATLYSLPQNQSEIYPIYSENGLSYEVQQAKNKVLNSRPKTSDVNTNLGYDLIRNNQIAELDLNANKTRSQFVDQYKTNILDAQDKYNKMRTDVENKSRQMIGAMIGQNKQFDAAATQKIGDNIQKYLNEFRENRANEITRRNQYKLKAMESNAAGHYKSDLYHEFEQLGGWKNVKSDLREKYADDWIKYMEGEWADRANLIKQYAYRDLYDYMMNDPYGSIMSPLFKNWELPKSIYVPFYKSDGYDKLGWNTEYKNGGKLNYIKTLYDRSENKDKDLIKIFSKL